MRTFGVLVLLGLWATACGSGHREDLASAGPQEVSFLLQYHQGVVFTPGIRPFEEQLEDMKALDADTAKFWLNWSAVQEEALYYDPASGRVSPSREEGFRWLEREDLDVDPGLVQAYAFPGGPDGRFHGHVDWAPVDTLILGLDGRGISPLPLIGDATTAPFVRTEEGYLLRIAPEPAGWESVSCAEGECSGYRGVGQGAYLGQLALHTAAAARRYQGVVMLWNTENELNWTPVHVLVAGWREGRAWFDMDFLGGLLQTLYEAVHIGAGERALATMNLNIHDPFWFARLRDWVPFMDVVGLGAYPNYLFSQPVLGDLLLDATDRALQATEKPVMVLETGYPTGPAERGYSEPLQADYLERTSRAVREKGCVGYLWYRLDDPAYIPGSDELQAVEAFWGLVDAKGKPKQSFRTFRETASEGASSHALDIRDGLPFVANTDR